MPKTIIDVMTIAWYGKAECQEAETFRKRVGKRQLNQQIKALVRQWLRHHR